MWSILYADDATFVSKTPDGLAKIMAVIVTVRSSRIHGFGKKYGDHAAANTGSCIPGSTVRHRSSRTEVYTGKAVST